MTTIIDCTYCSVDFKRKIMRAMSIAFNKPVLVPHYYGLEYVRSWSNYDNHDEIEYNSYVPTIIGSKYYYAKTFVNLGSL